MKTTAATEKHNFVNENEKKKKITTSYRLNEIKEQIKARK